MLVTPGSERVKTQLGEIFTTRVNTAVSKCTRIQRAVALANTLNKPGLLGLTYSCTMRNNASLQLPQLIPTVA